VTAAQLSGPERRGRLAGQGLVLQAGPLAVRIRTPLRSVQDYLAGHYADFPVADAGAAHFAVDVRASGRVRRFVRPQVTFAGDGVTPFHPLPAHMAAALFEWGFNWCVSRRVHHLLVVHAAVLSRNGHALLLPAPPGAGKSTLCAALVSAGWQFGSDEFALIEPETGLVHPLPRPISLKDQSVGIVSARWREAVFGPEVTEPTGARVRHLRPPGSGVAQAHVPLEARWVVLPAYRAGASTALASVPRARMLAHLADSSYNFTEFGARGFDCLRAIIDRSRCCTLTYSDLDEALAVCDGLARDTAV
jgi:HprK-related kinase A